ncbi:MAG TPA: SLBB domain-containing protein, partial [Polyangiaceae bacterium]|nr:SLBB domain-containing protein [Polyangiaceae bacterium]
MNRLLAGQELRAGPEPLTAHERRLGKLPPTGKDFIETLTRSGLVGKGGAGFPVGVKWRSVAGHSHGRAVIIANGAEGEPQSKKDRVLMATRPHLVLDGAFVAARTLRASRIVLYIGEDHAAARAAMARALSERTDRERGIVTISPAPARYVAGESSAAVHLVNAGIATPTTTPPHPHERGVDGGATLVQNVETLAHVALIARYGVASGTTLVTLAGGVSHPGVVEVEETATIGELVARCGGVAERPRAVLLGGYFGSWLDPDLAWTLPLDARALHERGYPLGCGVVGLLGASRCPVCETAGIMHYLA